MKKLVLLSSVLLASLSLAACSAHPAQPSSASSYSSIKQTASGKTVKNLKIPIQTEPGVTKAVDVKRSQVYGTEHGAEVLNSAWKGNVFKIHQVKIVTTTPFTYHDDKDGIYHAKGIAFVRYSIKAVAFDINSNTANSNLTENLVGGRTNIDSFDSQDTGTVKKGTTKTGIMVFPLVDNPSSIEAIHLNISFSSKSSGNAKYQTYSFNEGLAK